ncbi:chemotaxis protein CheY [Sulfuricella sp. T08]|uniref:ANTAR domain-containing response regulator n=1 Tax=Sulfuricella sp. T08 TaxID=1632857 RepID=UPI0006179E57|nr:response regulator [Sulfuricella sp. T08]GAO37376.1 chemotaxis protein CheY [Sulfuricella sp. T08]
MNPATILVVDDDRLILFTLAKGLRDAGYTVIEADSGEQAIEMCADISPDLAVLDIHMPGLSGLEVGQWLKEHTCTPFIFLSAYNDQATMRQATDSGALGYLVKPLDVDRILPTIQAALARAEDMHQLQQSEQHLNMALKSSRDISLAMGILMERNHINQQEAFELLRGSARNQRRKTAEIAVEIIAGKPVD